MMRIATLTLLLAALAGGACYNPDLSGDPGAFACSHADQTCPDKYHCDITRKVCVKDGADAAPGDQQVADATPHETAPDASPADLGKADAPAPAALTCALGNSDNLGNTAGGSGVGLAYDETQNALYASYVLLEGTTRHLVVRHQALLKTGKSSKVLDRPGHYGSDTAVAARKGQWVVIYQEDQTVTPKTQNFMALRSDKQSKPIKLASGSMAGQQPDVILLPNNGSFAAAHAFAKTSVDILTPKGEAIRVMGQQTDPFYTSKDASTGFDNTLAIDPSTRTIYYAMLAKSGGATTALIVKSPFASPTTQDISLGKLPGFSRPNAPGLDIAWPRLVATAKPQTGNANSEIRYRPDLSKTDSTPVPFIDQATTLINLGRPRIAARDGMVAVSAVDEHGKLWITVQDEKAAAKPWSPALQVSTSVAVDRMVATPGSSADEVIFRILYRAAATLKKTLYLRTLTCKRGK